MLETGEWNTSGELRAEDSIDGGNQTHRGLLAWARHHNEQEEISRLQCELAELIAQL